jgi:hypothetical protein
MVGKGLYMDIFKKIFKLLYKVFLMVRERFFLIPVHEETAPQFSPLGKEDRENIEFPQEIVLIQEPLTMSSSEGKEGSRGEEGEDMQIPSLENQRISLCETLDRVLNTGVVIEGDITISVANVDLIYIGLKALLTSVETARKAQAGGPA